LIDLRDNLSSSTHLVFHGYDFAIPDGRGVCHLGPWLKPTFDLRKFPTLAARQAVVEAMLRQFAALLTSLAAQPQKKVTFINGQGTLAPQTSSWHNELHPSKTGFNTFADIFYSKLKELFPDRVA
jgi:glucose dehydrogenase